MSEDDASCVVLDSSTCDTDFHPACADIPPIDAFKWMGVVMIAVSCFGVGGQYFPMWGGMFFPAKKGVTEEDYYFAEYNSAEREKGYHLASSAFVSVLFPFLCCLLAIFTVLLVDYQRAQVLICAPRIKPSTACLQISLTCSRWQRQLPRMPGFEQDAKQYNCCFEVCVLTHLLGMQANESRSMRGMKRTAADAAARFKAQQEANGADDTAHGIMDSSTSTTPMTNGATRNGV